MHGQQSPPPRPPSPGRDTLSPRTSCRACAAWGGGCRARAALSEPGCVRTCSVRVLCPLVSVMQELGKVMAVLRSREKLAVCGESNFIASLKVATVSAAPGWPAPPPPDARPPSSQPRPAAALAARSQAPRREEPEAEDRHVRGQPGGLRPGGVAAGWQEAAQGEHRCVPPPRLARARWGCAGERALARARRNWPAAIAPQAAAAGWRGRVERPPENLPCVASARLQPWTL